MEKICSRCGKLLALTFFRKCSKNKDGLKYVCSPCLKKDDKKYRIENPEKCKEQGAAWREIHWVEDRERRRKHYLNNVKRRQKIKEWQQNNRDKKLASLKKYRDSHKIEDAVRLKLNRAVKRGIVLKKPCEICQKSPADAHHSDYSKPLEVIWLCRRHHKAWHKIFIPEPA